MSVSAIAMWDNGKSMQDEFKKREGELPCIRQPKNVISRLHSYLFDEARVVVGTCY